MKRPTAVIARDDWYGHRDPLTGEPLGDRDEWISWDHALADAFQTIEDFTDSASGLPVWQIEDEAVEVDAVKKINKFRKSVEMATKGTEKKPYKPSPGEYFVPKIFSRRSDGSVQSFHEWTKKMSEKPED